MSQKTFESVIILIVFSLVLWGNYWAEGQIFPDKPFARLGKGTIRQIAYSPDGKLLAVAGSVGIWLYNADSLTEVGLLEGAVNSMAFSPDSKILTSGGGDGTIYLWDIHEQKQIGLLQGHTGPVLAVAYSSNESMLASVSSDKTVRLWNVESQQEVERFALPVQHAYGISISFSPDGKWLAAIGSDGKIYLWDVELKKEIENLLKGGEFIAFSPDGKLLASIIWGDEPCDTVILWDIETQKEVGKVKAGLPLFSISFSPDGKSLASGCYDSIIYLWDVARQEKIGELQGHESMAISLAFSPDGKSLASGGRDSTTRVWDIALQKQVGLLQDYTRLVTSLAFSPDGSLLASGGGCIDFLGTADWSIRLWDLEAQKQVGKLGNSGGYYSSVSKMQSLAFISDGKFLVSASMYDLCGATLWDVQGQKQVARLPGSYPVAFSPEVDILALGGPPLGIPLAPAKMQEDADRLIAVLWSAKTQQEIGELRGVMEDGACFVLSLALSPDGKLLASNSLRDTNISLWDVGTQKQIGALDQASESHSLAFSPDGRMLASGGNGGVSLWDVQNQKRLFSSDHTSAVTFVAISPDGKWLASGEGLSFDAGPGTAVCIMDMETRKQVDLLEGAGEISCLAISPDWKCLATGMSDGTILLWQLGTDTTKPDEELMVKPEGKLTTTMGRVKSTMLLQNFPNPFNPETWMPYRLSEDSSVVIKIHTSSGQLVQTLELGHKPAGLYTEKTNAAYWDGTNEEGKQVASGVYFYTIQAGDFTATKKMVVAK